MFNNLGARNKRIVTEIRRIYDEEEEEEVIRTGEDTS